MAREDFAGQEGGGGIVDFDMDVTDAWFGIAPGLVDKGFAHESGNPIIFLHLVGTTDLEDHPVLDDDGFHPSFKLKDGWEVTDDGKQVEFRGTGKPTLSSYYGKFVTAANKLTEPLANTPEDPLGGSNVPTNARTWIGTRWHFDEVSINWGSFGAKEHLMPTAYLGKSNAATTTATAAAPAAAANDNLRTQVENLARSAPDYETFQKLALNIDGVTGDGQLLTEIANPDGIYAKVNA